MKEFQPEVAEQLKHYVYRLLDPRDGHTFYVGKGQNNRVFDHASLTDEFIRDLKGGNAEDVVSAQVATISKIRAIQLEPITVIHRHGMDNDTAHEVESAVMDSFLRLDNAISGHNSELGPASPEELEISYGTEAFEIPNDKNLLLISINRSSEERSIYNAVRFAWKMSLERAKKADLVLAIRRNICVGVFQPDEWLSATHENFPDFETIEGRIGFKGSDMAETLEAEPFSMKRLPKCWQWKQGQATPFQYKYGRNQ